MYHHVWSHWVQAVLRGHNSTFVDFFFFSLCYISVYIEKQSLSNNCKERKPSIQSQRKIGHRIIPSSRKIQNEQVLIEYTHVTFVESQICLQSFPEIKGSLCTIPRLTAAIKYSPVHLCQRQTQRFTADNQNAKKPSYHIQGMRKKTDNFTTKSDRKRKCVMPLCVFFHPSSLNWAFYISRFPPQDNDNPGWVDALRCFK